MPLIYSRRSDGSVAFLSGCVPDLSLDSLAFYLDAAGGELYPDGAPALQVEFIAGEAGEQVTLSNARVTNQHHYRKMKWLKCKCGVTFLCVLDSLML